jgi:hypothetical protein
LYWRGFCEEGDIVTAYRLVGNYQHLKIETSVTTQRIIIIIVTAVVTSNVRV